MATTSSKGQPRLMNLVVTDGNPSSYQVSKQVEVAYDPQRGRFLVVSADAWMLIPILVLYLWLHFGVHSVCSSLCSMPIYLCVFVCVYACRLSLTCTHQYVL